MNASKVTTITTAFLFSLLTTLPIAMATHDSTSFELDGNATASATLAGDDWNDVSHAFASTGIIAEPKITDVTYFTGGGSKDVNDINQWSYGGNSVPDKDEITNAYAASYVNNANGVRTIYFGLDRFAVNGDGNVGFWFFKNNVQLGAGGHFIGVHANGDIFVAAAFTNGGAVGTVQVYEWVNGVLVGPMTTGAECAVPATTAGDECGIVNKVTTSAPWSYTPKTGPAGTFPISAFFEGGINITALETGVQCFSAFLAETRSSQTTSAQLKDFAFGNFDTCHAKIGIDPHSALNFLRTTHTFTINVSKDIGSGYVPAAGVLVTATITSGPGSFLGGNTCTTDSLGRCTVTITSSVAGTTIVSASANVIIGGGSFPVSTDGVAPNSRPAEKTWLVPLLGTSTTTTPSPDPVVLGHSVRDIANVEDENGAPVTVGNVTFFLCGNGVFPCLVGTQLGSPVALNASGMAQSILVTPSAVGTYCFRGNYSGATTANDIFSPSDDAGENECFVVQRAPSTTVTGPSAAIITLGGTVTDRAHITALGVGFPNPTGTVTFSLGGVQIGTPVALDASGIATSLGVTPNATGTYCFDATYSGDGNYSASHDNSSTECFVVQKAASHTVTLPAHDSIVLGASNSDNATVTGLGAPFPAPTGTITFYLNGVQIGLPVPLNATGMASSISVTPTAVGNYCFRADYSGDSNYNASSDHSAAECFPVTPSSSRTHTEPSSAKVTLGASVSDNAVITGLGPGFPAPTGTITFYLQGVQIGLPKAINGSGMASSDPVTPGAAGSYCFSASYSGDGNYSASSDAGENECFLVDPAASRIVSVPSSLSIELGGNVSDQATVSGLGGSFPAPTGLVTFYLDGVQIGLPVALNASGMATSILVTPHATGTYCFRADYAGDGNYSASSDHSAGECFDVTPTSSHAHTVPSSARITLGGNVSDDVTITGLGAGFPTPTGNVTFFLDGVPIGLPVDLDASGMASSESVTPLAAGSYCFGAHYSGDGNYSSSSDQSANECFVVDPAPSTVVSLPSHTTIVLGGNVSDQATVSGLGGAFPAPTGNVTFYLDGVQIGLPVALDASGLATSIAVTPTAVGTYCFRADYAGDANYNASSDHSVGECFNVTQAPSDTQTLPSSAKITLGGMVHDEAAVTGLGIGFPVPTGTVTFYLDGVQIGLAVALNASGMAASDPVKPLAAGSYCFSAFYSGDGNYSASHDNSSTECFVVDPAPSTTVTAPSHESIVLGGSVSDQATITGLGGSFPAPTGMVTFYLDGIQIGVPTALNASGMASSISVTPTSVGGYCFRADYAGDANYSASSDHGTHECFNVTRAPSSTVTAPSDDSIVLGDSVSDQATITGLGVGFPAPTGLVTFYLDGVQIGLPVALNESGMATSDGVTPLAAGRQCFRADYAGDGNYSASSDHSANECFNVTRHPTNTTTSPSQASIALGGSVHDTAVVSGGLSSPAPTGAVTFYLCSVGVVPCASGGSQIGPPVALVNGTASSGSVTPSAGGTYCFRGVYSGDGNYSGSQDASQGECFTVVANLATRTQGFWSTHLAIATTVWNSIPASQRVICTKNLGDGVNDIPELMGGFWASVSKKTTGAARSPLDHARMQALQQLLAAKLNVQAFGSNDGGAIAAAMAVICGTNTSAILSAASALDHYNNSGDTIPINLNQGAASPALAKLIANKAFWNTWP